MRNKLYITRQQHVQITVFFQYFLNTFFAVLQLLVAAENII